MEEMSYAFSLTFFMFSLHWWPLAFLILSPLLQNFHVVPPTKNVSFVFISCFRSLSPGLLSFFHLLSLFLSLSLALYSKFVDMTINLSFILQTTWIQKQFLLSVFVFIDSLAASVLQDARGYAISRQNNLELHMGCHTC